MSEETLFHGSDGIPIEDDPSLVYDSGALEVAERAAREALSTDDEIAASGMPTVTPDESWVMVATVPSADPGRSLEPVYQALCQAGIPASFDPYRPGVASSPQPFLQRAFHVVVPESQLAAAQAVLKEMGVELPGGEHKADATHVMHEGSAPSGARDSRRPMTPARRALLILVAVLLLAFAVEIVVSMLFELGVVQ